MNQLEHRSKDSAAGGLGRDATRHHKDPIELGWGRAKATTVGNHENFLFVL